MITSVRQIRWTPDGNVALRKSVVIGGILGRKIEATVYTWDQTSYAASVNGNGSCEYQDGFTTLQAAKAWASREFNKLIGNHL